MMAELAERFEEIEPVTSAPLVPVSDGAFASVFDVPLFATLGSPERTCFSTGHEVRFKIGDTVISEGDASNYFHVMLEGELRVTKFFDNQEIFLGVLEPGEFFGEIQILLDISHVVLHSSDQQRPHVLPSAGGILGFASHGAAGRSGNHANSGNAVAQYGGLHAGTGKACATRRDGRRARS